MSSSSISKTWTYLALGDSYTIGENVPLFESYPYQAVQLLRKMEVDCSAPEIIARTGWSTTDLRKHLETYRFQHRYDFVSILIGVNNQYRGMAVSNYALDLENLINWCIELNGSNERLIVLSIPDWSTTPFAQGKNRDVVSKEIALFNRVNQAIARKKSCHYVDITSIGDSKSSELCLVSSDGLHPSGTGYEKWAQSVAHIILKESRGSKNL